MPNCGSTIVVAKIAVGVLVDCVPPHEYEETLNKARGLLKAIEITQQRNTS